MLLQKNSDKVKQIPDNEAKRISNANEVIILRDQDKEIKFKSPIKEDDDYYMYMISHFIDDDFSIKSAEEDSKRILLAILCKEKGKEVLYSIIYC